MSYSFLKLCKPLYIISLVNFLNLSLPTNFGEEAFLKHHRKVDHWDGASTRKLALFKKSIHSIIDLREILLGCNSRYLEFLSSLNDYSNRRRALQQQTKTETVNGTQICGLRRIDLKKHLPLVSNGKLSRFIKRQRTLGLFKWVAKSIVTT